MRQFLTMEIESMFKITWNREIIKNKEEIQNSLVILMKIRKSTKGKRGSRKFNKSIRQGKMTVMHIKSWKTDNLIRKEIPCLLINFSKETILKLAIHLQYRPKTHRIKEISSVKENQAITRFQNWISWSRKVGA